MLTNEEFIRRSLEADLFYSRTFMENATLILTEEGLNKPAIDESFENEQKKYGEIDNEVLGIADNRVTEKFLDTKQIVTLLTKPIEEETMRNFDVSIDVSLTERSLALQSGSIVVTDELLNKITEINKKILDALSITLEKLEKLSREVDSKYMEPLDHIIRECEAAISEMRRLIDHYDIDPTYIYNLLYTYDEFMLDFAVFFGLVINPTYIEEIKKFNIIADNYRKLLKQFNNDISPYTIASLIKESQNITISFRNDTEKLNDEVAHDSKHIIVAPLFTDHILREINNFLAILNNISNMS